MYKPTIVISFHNLAVVRAGQQHYPLEMFTIGDHIHGGLYIQIAGRRVPYMGYEHKDDVCFGQWIEELAAVRTTFRGHPQATYVFDEGEQGQPAFQFERKGDMMLLSIIDSTLSDGRARSDWQQVPFQYNDFVQAYDGFKQLFLAEIARVVPAHVDYWTRLFR